MVAVVVVSAAITEEVVDDGALDESMGAGAEEGVSAEGCVVEGAASVELSSRTMKRIVATASAATAMTERATTERRSMMRGYGACRPAGQSASIFRAIASPRMPDSRSLRLWLSFGAWI